MNKIYCYVDDSEDITKNIIYFLSNEDSNVKISNFWIEVYKSLHNAILIENKYKYDLKKLLSSFNKENLNKITKTQFYTWFRKKLKSFISQNNILFGLVDIEIKSNHNQMYAQQILYLINKLYKNIYFDHLTIICDVFPNINKNTVNKARNFSNTIWFNNKGKIDIMFISSEKNMNLKLLNCLEITFKK